MSNEGKLWNYFLNVFGNEKAVAGLLGNIKAESDFLPDNLQNSFEKTLGLSPPAEILSEMVGIRCHDQFSGISNGSSSSMQRSTPSNFS